MLMSTFLFRSTTSQGSSYLIVLKRLGEPRYRYNPHLKLWKFRESNRQPHGKEADMPTIRPVAMEQINYEIILMGYLKHLCLCSGSEFHILEVQTGKCFVSILFPLDAR